ncbi:FOG: RCC1 domain [Plasmopara halstedii]|uniref:FOG: RCC1 domain n=1 Tax=Plasmopara halstedii TaxID=4781 RepID=A0A0P1AA17_PLAHL|nr:FOG: RCC1 domain [Plasmopara halstedii]CEG37205.1 FOG: RCC1 domain [Plasmopara halstedii]|eukprot:XP_024573574.1 FOG: RCC1 domain [Plasmopara halstedii]
MDRKFMAVDGGDTFTMGIEADSGKVFGWGRAFYGELLDGFAEKDQPLVKIKIKEPCNKVVCGCNHVLALACSGCVYAWGWNRSGQVTAAKSDEVVHTPTKVQFFLHAVYIVEVAAGGMHSLALDSDGRVWAWGCNAYGQLGIGVREKQLTTPALVEMPANVQAQSIAAGWAHNAIISTSGEVFTFGWGLYNQLGHGSTHNELQPLAVEALRGLDSDIAQVACGTWHTAALTASGDLYTWGWKRDGQLGPRDPLTPQVLPSVVNILSGSSTNNNDDDITAIACGNRCTVALCKNGLVHYWGPRSAIPACQDSRTLLLQGWPHSITSRTIRLAASSSNVILLLEHQDQDPED